MERVRDYELKAFFTYVVQVLERLGIPYIVVVRKCYIVRAR
jgi:hypothetical protein